MAKTFDVIVVGGGIYGCATAYHLARLGAGRVVVLERGALSAGGTGRSCAIVRTHYSIEVNLLHAVASLEVFANFGELVGGDAGWRRTGYLIVGPEEHGSSMRAVFDDQRRHGIDTAELTAAEAGRIHPLIRFEGVGVIGFDSDAGYADPVRATRGYADRALGLGVEILESTPVVGLSRAGGAWTAVTPSGDLEAGVVVSACGPWTGEVLAMAGAEAPVEISCHRVVVLRGAEPYRADFPIVKDLTTPDKIYFRPEPGGGVLVGTGDHGVPITDPEEGFADDVGPDHVERVRRLISNRMPGYAGADVASGWTGPYDITPDWNPVVGPVPGLEGLHVMAGFSGHGFKLAPTLSRSMAETVLGLVPELPIEPYGLGRFTGAGRLQGRYGIGSIS